MEATTLLTRNEGILSTEIDGETVLMSVDSGKYFTLNSVGTAIWTHLATPISLSALQERLLEQFDGDRQTILSETQSYLQDLATRGLIN